MLSNNTVFFFYCVIVPHVTMHVLTLQTFTCAMYKVDSKNTEILTSISKRNFMGKMRKMMFFNLLCKPHDAKWQISDMRR